MATDAVATMVTNIKNRLIATGEFFFGAGHDQYAEIFINEIMQEFKDQIAKMEVDSGGIHGGHTSGDGTHAHAEGKIS